MILSQAEGARGRLAQAQAAARTAYAKAGSRRQRFAAAVLLARADGAARAFLASEFWLRRASDLAGSDRDRAFVAAAMGEIRKLDPWRAVLRFSIAPSSNLNGGAESGLLTVAGLPFVGLLSGTARALSGTRETLTFDFARRIVRGPSGQTEITGRLAQSFNQLSAAARRLAPGTSGTAFDMGQVEFGLRHEFGDPSRPAVTSVGASLGGLWYGGSPYERYLRLDLARRGQLGRMTQGRLALSLQHQWMASGPPADLVALSGALTRRLRGGGAVVPEAGLLALASSDGNQAYWGGWMRVEYRFARPLGPVRISAGLGAGFTRYPDYSVFFGVPGGRRDTSVSADITFSFRRPSVMGFAPELRLSEQRSFSNVSRFSTRNLGLTLGVKSLF